MFPIEISSDECLRKQQSKRNDPSLIPNISSEYVRDYNSVRYLKRVVQISPRHLPLSKYSSVAKINLIFMGILVCLK
ncbi:hypothetical protein M0R45_019830 [Rubus argutus]|uniref:Uncharacterized protein n=1 Tax=Rubus argutus TaxID=59490 RepID=A0AAW1X6Y7_RUBAR